MELHKMKDNYMVVIGNIFDGFSFYGPFATFDDASDWADTNAISSEWWVASVEIPKTADR
jgi:hypothetical protein